jgi:KDO2-lipid IV(A) lauroyltransferase
MGVLLFPIRILPSRAIEILAWILGNFVFFTIPRRRRIALENLRRALGNELSPSEIRALARRNFVHVFQVFLEIARLPQLAGKIETEIPLEDDRPLREALNAGKGALLLVSHLGNWAYAAARVAASFPTVIVARPPSNRLVRRAVEEIPRIMKIEIVPRQKGMRRILRAVGQGKVVFIALDQHASKNSVAVDFFGRPAATSTVLALLALRLGTPVVPAFTWREGRRLRLVFLPEVPITRSGDQERDIRENTQNFTRIIEEHIRAHPDQWLWSHRRWRLD